ncbi:MAG: TIR domain-containing protein [Okeania sp. SIO3B3]|nr:TIR domain-containing protein [Okeania sp. SIO3B3]
MELSGYTGESAKHILSGLARIDRWERTLKLQNYKSGARRLNPKDVEFLFYEIRENGEEIRHSSEEIILNYDEYTEEEGIPYVLKVRNGSDRRLFFTLLYLSPRFGIHSLTPCESLPYTDREIILDDNHTLRIPDKASDEVTDTFLLIVSTEELDEFLFEQEEIGKEQSFKDLGVRKKGQADWFTKSITVKTVRNHFSRLKREVHKNTQIFLSYAREDGLPILDVYRKLKQAGYKVWLDTEDLIPGQVWDDQISKVIRASDFIIVFFSTVSVAKRGYLQKELKLALDVLETIPDDRIFIVPVRLDECEVPEKFNQFQYCDLFKGNSFEKLLKALEKEGENNCHG